MLIIENFVNFINKFKQKWDQKHICRTVLIGGSITAILPSVFFLQSSKSRCSFVKLDPDPP